MMPPEDNPMDEAVPTKEDYDEYELKIAKAGIANLKACTPDPLSEYRNDPAFEVELAANFTAGWLHRSCDYIWLKENAADLGFQVAKRFVEEMNKRFPKP